MRSRTTSLALALALLLPAAASAAPNKEHLQLLAEIRMLQEQQQQLQKMMGALSDAVKAVSTKLDQQGDVTRKALADQQLSLNGLGDNLRIVREKMDDTNVRVGTISQEIDALRQAIQASAQQAAVGAVPGTQPAPGGAPTEPSAANPTGVPGTAPTPQGVPPSPLANAVSPQRAYDASFDDYTAGRYDLAISGFQTYIQQFPKSPRAGDAEFYIGQSYYAQNKWPEARAAFQSVVTDYPQSSSVPDAYYKLGLTYERLGQIDLAKQTYQTLVKSYQGNAAILAQQALERLNRK